MMHRTQLIRYSLIKVRLLVCSCAFAQTQVDLTNLDKKGMAKVKLEQEYLEVTCPIENNQQGKLQINLDQDKPFFKSMEVWDVAANGGFTQQV